ncbi:MAG: putative transcriptional regulator [Actinomycetia bacterium]|nr:putative transcriptional regulator [Actinomycetes bacterium]
MRSLVRSCNPGEVSSEPEASALRCLIVDDNPEFLAAARELLEREGLSVAGVASMSAEALRLARHLQPDFILVDIDLGEESGFDLAQQLADADHAPVVLISAYAEVEFADLIAASPAAGFVSKSELSASAVADALEAGAR